MSLRESLFHKLAEDIDSNYFAELVGNAQAAKKALGKAVTDVAKLDFSDAKDKLKSAIEHGKRGLTGSTYESSLADLVKRMADKRRKPAGKTYYGDVEEQLANAMRSEQGVSATGTGRLYFDDASTSHTGDRHVAAAGTQSLVSEEAMRNLLGNIAAHAQAGTLKHSLTRRHKPLMAWVQNEDTLPGDYVDFAALSAQKDGDFRTVTAFPRTLDSVLKLRESNNI